MAEKPKPDEQTAPLEVMELDDDFDEFEDDDEGFEIDDEEDEF